jgi:acetylglutamate kinase
MKDLIEKAEVLVEAMPYIRRFANSTIVLKYGGSAMSDAGLRASFARDVVLLKYIGLRPVIVHGGGPQIGRTLERLGVQSTFVDGLRVTDDQTMDVVEMVLGGTVNREIVALIQQAGGRAIGLTGNDGDMIRVTRRTSPDRDLGRVGQVRGVDPAPIIAVADAGYVPVIAPIGVDGDGVTHNVNGDEAAGAVAEAHGVLMPQLTIPEARKHIAEGTIRGGMIPKIECCISALESGVGRTHIVDGRIQHAILLEIFTDTGVGTLLGR